MKLPTFALTLAVCTSCYVGCKGEQSSLDGKPTSIGELLVQANNLEKQGRLREAEILYTRGVQAERDNPEIWQKLAALQRTTALKSLPTYSQFGVPLEPGISPESKSRSFYYTPNENEESFSKRLRRADSTRIKSDRDLLDLHIAGRALEGARASLSAIMGMSVDPAIKIDPKTVVDEEKAFTMVEKSVRAAADKASKMRIKEAQNWADDAYWG